MTPCLVESIGAVAPGLQEPLEAALAGGTLEEMIERVEIVTRSLALLLIGAILTRRALAPTAWPGCPACDQTLRSKGFAPREVLTRWGIARWRRRLGRGPRGCSIGQIAPLDTALGLLRGQRTSLDLQRTASLLAVFVPLETAATILRRMYRVRVCSSANWNWVQTAGERAEARLQAELAELEATGAVAREQIEARIAQWVLLSGADGVMVPFRPTPGSPKGTTVWREVKLAVLARLDQHLRRNAPPRVKLARRRLVAVLGDIDALAARLNLEAMRQGITVAPCVVWVRGPQETTSVVGGAFADRGPRGCFLGCPKRRRARPVAALPRPPRSPGCPRHPGLLPHRRPALVRRRNLVPPLPAKRA